VAERGPVVVQPLEEEFLARALLVSRHRRITELLAGSTSVDVRGQRGPHRVGASVTRSLSDPGRPTCGRPGRISATAVAALRVTGRRRVRRTSRLRAPRALARQPLGPPESSASGGSGGRMSCSTGLAAASPTGSTRATGTRAVPRERASRFPAACSLTARLRARPVVDVEEDGNGLLRAGRLCQLICQHDAAHERTLEITLVEPGAQAYVFTFG
jgi:thioredoxin family protein